MNLSKLETVQKVREAAVLELTNHYAGKLIESNNAIYLLAECFYTSPRVIKKIIKKTNGISSNKPLYSTEKQLCMAIYQKIEEMQKQIKNKVALETIGIVSIPEMPKDWNQMKNTKEMVCFPSQEEQNKIQHAIYNMLCGFSSSDVIKYHHLTKQTIVLLNKCKGITYALEETNKRETFCFECLKNAKKMHYTRDLLSAVFGYSNQLAKNSMHKYRVNHEYPEKRMKSKYIGKTKKECSPEIVYQLWLENGYTQQEIADMFGLSRGTITNWLRLEKDKRHNTQKRIRNTKKINR